MARYTEAVCRICRRENNKLFLKGDRCFANKCAFERHAQAPGMHGTHRGKPSEYGLQLREKQKVKRSYGLMEKQFRSLFEKAERQKGVTGANLLVLLERRLDNIVYRLGFASSRSQARQLVCHGHFLVNGRKVDIPSYLVRAGDAVSLREKSRRIAFVQESLETVVRRGLPEWLELDKASFVGRVRELPAREALTPQFSEQLIVELYSK
ncbi:MAG: 30S ribosomal protein S4 [Deltaproteobacteria bacterium]|nr:30S ribosomal protein S4 [Deltaproteobacteria bacterium]MDR1296183.1 30S ribosomal protein S4 [Deltaproteobacteria bacterium]